MQIYIIHSKYRRASACEYAHSQTLTPRTLKQNLNWCSCSNNNSLFFKKKKNIIKIILYCVYDVSSFFRFVFFVVSYVWAIGIGQQFITFSNHILHILYEYSIAIYRMMNWLLCTRNHFEYRWLSKSESTIPFCSQINRLHFFRSTVYAIFFFFVYLLCVWS